MNILIANTGKIPVINYGGTERVIWYLGKELVKKGHKVTYLVKKGSSCHFGNVLYLDPSRPLSEQIPEHCDIVHFNFPVKEEIRKPYIITQHGNCNDQREFDINTVFISRNHADRHGSRSFVYNGLDWDDYGSVVTGNKRGYFHFLGNAAWRLKNVRGAIHTIHLAKDEKLKVIGGYRLNIRMGFRLTLNPRVTFHGMVNDRKKNNILQHSKGLIFPVRWHEPFGLSLIESLYFGCPVFGTPYGSLPEIVNKEVGFLSNRSEELAKELKNAAQYSAKTCHEYAADVFNSGKMAEAYLEKYNKVLNGGSLNAEKPKLREIQREKFLEWG